MRHSILLLVFGLLIVATQDLSAQERVKNRAENRANQNIDRKVDQAVDGAFNKIGGLFKKKNKKKKGDTEAADTNQVEATPGMGFLNKFGGPTEPWEPYQNDSPISFTMDMVQKKNGKVKDESTMHLSFDTWQVGYRIETEENEAEEVRLIMDNKEGYMTMITTDKQGKTEGFKMKQRYSFQIDQEEMEAELEETLEDFDIQKTGNRRTINGYDCEEYIITTEDAVVNSWLTTDLDFDLASYMRMFTKNNQGKSPFANNTDLPYEGFPIEQTYISKDGKTESTTTFRDIQTGSNIDLTIFDTSGVKIMDLGM